MEYNTLLDSFKIILSSFYRTISFIVLLLYAYFLNFVLANNGVTWPI